MVGGRRPIHRGWLQEGVMSILPPTDEERGKKDDDWGRSTAPKWKWWSLAPRRWRRRRLLLAVVGLYLSYLLLTNLPALGPRTPPSRWGAATDAEQHHVEPSGPPPGFKAPRDGHPPLRDYNGQIRFYRLGATLRGAAHTNGYSAVNRNVLFAISSLKSAATLLPLICEMSQWNRNHVHAAFMGREDIPLRALLEINGVDNATCAAIWHDARPDYAEYSSDARAESSVMAAMMHIHSSLHPQVAVMDDSLSEDAFFVKGIRAKAAALEVPVIEIAKDRWENFLWMTRLDSGSLRSWHKPTVDIVIQVPSDSSGGLLRLLKSLKSADYSGLNPPRLTIEIPASVDSSVQNYLESFAWPPVDDGTPPATSQMTIRRRITNKRATQEDSAIRVLELFYPTSRANSHVLLLSPNAELSPLYYHYLKYVMLEYKYSSFGRYDSSNLMGVSLERPSVLLDGKTELLLPSAADMHTPRYRSAFPNEHSTQFLWQAPNSHAALFFGDKWAEFHSFLSNRVAKHHLTPKATARPKMVSETLPAWTEYMVEFMQARGYPLLYPASSGSESLVRLHNELYHAPEEFSHDLQGGTEPAADAARKLLNEPFLLGEAPPPRPAISESATIPYSRPLHMALPFDGDLPEMPHLPYLSSTGEKMAPGDVSSVASRYAAEFRETVGGCPVRQGQHRRVEFGSAKDLFCFGDEDEGDWEDDEAAMGEGEDGPVVSATHGGLEAEAGAAASAAATETETVAVASASARDDGLID